MDDRPEWERALQPIAAGDVDIHGDVCAPLTPAEQLVRLRALAARLGPSRRAHEPMSAADLHAAMFGHRMRRGCCADPEPPLDSAA